MVVLSPAILSATPFFYSGIFTARRTLRVDIGGGTCHGTLSRNGCVGKQALLNLIGHCCLNLSSRLFLQRLKQECCKFTRVPPVMVQFPVIAPVEVLATLSGTIDKPLLLVQEKCQKRTPSQAKRQHQLDRQLETNNGQRPQFQLPSCLARCWMPAQLGKFLCGVFHRLLCATWRTVDCVAMAGYVHGCSNGSGGVTLCCPAVTPFQTYFHFCMDVGPDARHKLRM